MTNKLTKLRIKMINKIIKMSILPVGLMLSTGSAHAAYTTFLNITNNQNWAQPQDFALVTIDSIDVGGGDFDFMFTVDLCGDGTSSACGQQIEQFGFNFSAVTLADTNFDFSMNTAGPGTANWSTNFSATMDGFGGFDVAVEMPTGSGAAGVDPLMFLITGVTGDSIATYATDGSTGGQPNAGSLFAAKVSSTGPGAFIGGGSPVPVPAAVWLFGSGLLGLVGIARRKKA